MVIQKQWTHSLLALLILGGLFWLTKTDSQPLGYKLAKLNSTKRITSESGFVDLKDNPAEMVSEVLDYSPILDLKDNGEIVTAKYLVQTDLKKYFNHENFSKLKTRLIFYALKEPVPSKQNLPLTLYNIECLNQALPQVCSLVLTP